MPKAILEASSGGALGGGHGVLLIVVIALVALRLSLAARRRRQPPPDDGEARSRPDSGGAPRPMVTAMPRVTTAGTGDVLEVRNLTVAYGAQLAVDDLSFGIGRGEIFGLLGPNGAGKTSTLSAIEGLLRPQSGRVLVDRIDVRAQPNAARAKLGVQLQETSFQAELTITQIVRLYAGLYGVQLSDGELAERLQSTRLQSHAHKPFRQLSGGQQQRLSLLIALIHDPVLLLLDEPTTGLDPQSRRQLWRRIERIRATGASVLLTTHSMEEAQAVCDRVAIVDHGRLLAAGPPRELIDAHRDDPLVREAAHGDVTLEDVFIGLTGGEIRD
jgi:ABC-2 type transport system ATP-binding protein